MQKLRSYQQNFKNLSIHNLEKLLAQFQQNSYKFSVFNIEKFTCNTNYKINDIFTTKNYSRRKYYLNN